VAIDVTTPEASGHGIDPATGHWERLAAILYAGGAGIEDCELYRGAVVKLDQNQEAL